jgi:hypothetical protein
MVAMGLTVAAQTALVAVAAVQAKRAQMELRDQ